MASPEPDSGGDGGAHVRKWIRKKGPIALRSEVWKHFCELEGDKNIIKCDNCPKEFKYYSSTTNLRAHLKNVHHISLGKETDEGTSSSTSSASQSKDGKAQMSIENSIKKMTDKDSLDKVVLLLCLFWRRLINN